VAAKTGILSLMQEVNSLVRRQNSSAPLTTAQQLGSIVKSARDIMRKDKGLNGDLDRLPVLTWIMFLKFLDDMERIREEEAILSGDRFRPAVEPPYRWRDWAAYSLAAADANGSFTTGSSYQAWKG
jgi:type I restriction enzyme M protein